MLSRAAAKSAAAKLRGVGALSLHPQWAARAQACERCPMRVIRRGVSYCGEPLLQQIERRTHEGCGCPTIAKAKSPGEHCPVAQDYTPPDPNACNCKWCLLAAASR